MKKLVPFLAVLGIAAAIAAFSPRCEIESRDVGTTLSPSAPTSNALGVAPEPVRAVDSGNLSRRPLRDTRTPRDGSIEPAPGAAIENLELPPLGSLKVVVQDAHSRPVVGALISIAGTEVEKAAKSDSRGQFLFTLAKDQKVWEVKAIASGYVSTCAFLSDQSAPRGAVTLVMRPSGSFRVSVFDQYGQARRSHWVEAYMASDATTVTVDGVESAPVQRMTGLTDAEGSVTFDGLGRGVWDFYAPRWRACEASPHAFVEVLQDVEGDLNLTVVEEPLETFASGRILLPLDAHTVDGRIMNYSLIVSSTNRDIPLYAGGDFAVFGSPGDVLSLHVRHREKDIRSEEFAVVVGQHLLRCTPDW